MNQAKNVNSFNYKHSIMKMENVESMYDNIENNTVKQLRALAKSQGLKGYYKLNKSNLIDVIKNHIASSAQDMDVFEKQEMAKNRKVVTSKINKFYNWLISFVPEPIKDKSGKAYRLMKSQILGLYKSVGHTDQTVKEETRQEIEEGDSTEPKIILIGDTTRIKKYEVTGNLNNNLSNLIFNNIKAWYPLKV